MFEQLRIRQSEKYEGEDWWTWSVWLEGPDDALDTVESVEWVLHPTFPNPVRRTRDRARQFRLETGGWGVFQIKARVHARSGDTLMLRHDLKLHYPDGTENTK